jgi:spermidine synthase
MARLLLGSASRYMLEITVFVCGALVMIYEIIGSRLLSPFIGVSTYVWTSLIGVILASLSLGYWLGGKTADRRPNVGVLAAAIFIAGGCVSVTILLKDIILSFIASAHTGLEVKSVIASLLLFAPASVALGFVTPYAVKLKMSALADSGKTVGGLFAFSTVGSIVGTFAAGFFLIPFVGSVRTLYLIAGTLIILSLLLVPFAVSRLQISVLVLFVLALAASEFSIYFVREKSGLHDIDTEYSRVQVFETTDPATGRRIRGLATDPYFTQSAVFLDSDEPVLRYSRYYHLLRHFKPDFQNTVMIGGAGFTFPREYLRAYPQARINVVEIDPQMTEIARRFFRLQDDPRLSITHRDGRVFLDRAPAGAYDVVLMDAFGSLFNVPYQLTTVEAVREISRVLAPDGVVIFNLGSAITGDGSKFLQAELKTYQEIFPHVYLFKVNSDYADERLQNLIIVGAKGDVPAAQSSDEAINTLLSHRYTGDIPLTVPALTDDLAPVEYYNSIAQDLYVSTR